MANKSGEAYGLTVLSPIINGFENDESYSACVRDRLQKLPLDQRSPMAGIPETYLARFYVLDDVPYQGSPARVEHLKSKYLVFSSNFHGELEPYLTKMWQNSEPWIRHIWQYCVGFESVQCAQDFIDYIQKCQVNNNLFFNGSTDQSLAEQLKGLYLKQEFSRFVYENQGRSAEQLQDAFARFLQYTRPDDVNGPSWPVAATSLDQFDTVPDSVYQPEPNPPQPAIEPQMNKQPEVEQ